MSDVQMTSIQQIYLGMVVVATLAFMAAIAWGRWQSRD
jgi:hypothetical protein